MKLNQSICLILIALCLNSIQSDYVKESRHFLKGLLTSVNGKDYSLDDNCLGAEFVQEVTKLITAIRKENSILAFSLINNILSTTEKNCPKNELTKIVKDAEKSYASGNIMPRAVSHSRDLMHNLSLLLDEKDPESFGKIVGKLINFLVYDETQNYSLTFLGADLNETAQEIYNLSKVQVQLFVEGFFEGISDVPYEQNLCKNDAACFNDEIVKVFTDVINAAKTRENILDTFSEICDLVLKLKPLNDNCRFSSLFMNLIALNTKVGFAKLVFNITRNYKETYENLKGLYTSIKSDDSRTAGVNWGMLTKLGLNYSTK